MKNIYLTIFLFIFSLNLSYSQNKSAYKLFDKDGNEAEYSELLSSALNSRIILFGELHNNPISHFLQIELTKDLYKETGKNLVLGAEMFEADDQIVLDEYMKGIISEKNFKSETKLWNNYNTDYKPLIEFAKSNKLKFVASNIPRRYASVVFKSGLQALDSLDSNAYKWIAPLPVQIDLSLKSYAALTKGMDGHMGKDENKKNYLAEAQAIKDATMAYFILINLDSGSKLIHFNGAYHSDIYEGIYWFLKKEKPSINILTISTVEQDDISVLKEENLNKADFIIIVDSDMTKTYESK